MTTTPDEAALRLDGSAHARLLLADHLQELGREREACVERIAAELANDVWRLQWADWLECNGAAEYAEFVRVQCELAKPCPHGYSDAFHVDSQCPTCDPLHDRQKRLLSQHEDAFRRGPACEACEGKGKLSIGGGTVRVAGRDMGFTSGTVGCSACNGTGDIGGLTGAVPHEPRDAKQRIPVEWRRGCPERVACLFGEVMEQKSDPNGYCKQAVWQPTEWARRVCRWHPVLELWPTDLNPIHREGARTGPNRGAIGWDWSSAHVPHSLFNEMAAAHPERLVLSEDEKPESLRWLEFPGRELALLALATALARLARKADP